jgi:hypothetical protein
MFRILDAATILSLITAQLNKTPSSSELDESRLVLSQLAHAAPIATSTEMRQIAAMTRQLEERCARTEALLTVLRPSKPESAEWSMMIARWLDRAAWVVDVSPELDEPDVSEARIWHIYSEAVVCRRGLSRLDLTLLDDEERAEATQHLAALDLLIQERLAHLSTSAVFGIFTPENALDEIKDVVGRAHQFAYPEAVAIEMLLAMDTLMLFVEQALLWDDMTEEMTQRMNAFEEAVKPYIPQLFSMAPHWVAAVRYGLNLHGAHDTLSGRFWLDGVTPS